MAADGRGTKPHYQTGTVAAAYTAFQEMVWLVQCVQPDTEAMV